MMRHLWRCLRGNPSREDPAQRLASHHAWIINEIGGGSAAEANGARGGSTPAGNRAGAKGIGAAGTPSERGTPIRATTPGATVACGSGTPPSGDTARGGRGNTKGVLPPRELELV